MAYPLEQGLKLPLLGVLKQLGLVLMAYPLEQGLKHEYHFSFLYFLGGLNGLSTRTRIETERINA